MNVSVKSPFRSFRRKLFIIFSLSAGVAIGLLTVIGLIYAKIALTNSVKRDLQLIASRTAGELDQYFAGKMDMVIAARELLSYPGENRFKLELMLKRISLEFLHIKKLGLYDASNQLIASSNPDNEIYLPKEIFNTTISGKTYRSSMIFSKSSLPYIRIAVPLFWQGEVFRILEAEIDIMAVWNKIDDLKIGNTGRASLLSEDGTFLADADKGLVLKRRKWSDIILSGADMPGEKGTMEMSTRDGINIFVSYAEIPSNGWKLVITQERGEALHFLTIMMYQALGMIALALVSAYFIASWLSRRTSRPVEELHTGVQEISKGNLNYRMPALEGYEFSTLADGFNSMAQSIQEKERTEKELAIVSKLAAVGRLAADVAHEINNPLAIMKNYIYIISKKKMAEDDPNQQYMVVIDKEIDRVAKIIRSFNDFYKGSQAVPMEEVDLAVPVDEVISFCKEDMEEKGILIDAKIANVGKVMADKDKLKQVFLNLIKNSAEAMPNGGRITVETKKDQGMISVSVADTGVGISKNNLEKLFTPFFSTKGVKGTGLGLSVSYGIIKNFNGNIEVESEEGKGTTVRVVLPTAVKKNGGAGLKTTPASPINKTP